MESHRTHGEAWPNVIMIGEIISRSTGGGPPGHGPALAGRRVIHEHEKTKDIIAGQFCQRCGAWLGCLGLEPTPELFVSHIVDVFREVRRVLKIDGTLWLNLGDSYATGAGYYGNPWVRVTEFKTI